MALSIIALDRGGYTAHGNAHFDPRDHVVRVKCGLGESIPLTVQFNETVSSVAETENGITGSAPAASGQTFTATLTDLNQCGQIEYLVTLSTGEIRKLVLEANRTDAQQVARDYYWRE
ncbi:MAG: hypothetical protein AB7O04_07355 [Hyphomonadaceae bacterium]